MNDQYAKQSKQNQKDNDPRAWQKIPFRIVHVSSEEEEYSAKELINHTPFSRGWQSARFCNYPQEILIEFPKLIRMREIQFLSHQYNIASKIEIYINIPGQDKFKKIGFLSLDSNERSNFQARELKTVYTDFQLTQVKFSLLRCHTNRHNIHAQVGLIAISILGEYPNSTKEYWGNKADNNFAKLQDEMIYDPATLKRLKDLYKAKDKAVELEDFEEAKRIKIAIDSLKSVSQSLIQLEERKKIAIKNDDFDAAKLIKYEIDRLRNAVAGVNLEEINKHEMEKQQQQQQQRQQYKKIEQQQPMRQTPQEQKTKLFQNNQDPYQINNEFEMENDDDIYRIRNVNQGYKPGKAEDQFDDNYPSSNEPKASQNEYSNNQRPSAKGRQNNINNSNNATPMQPTSFNNKTPQTKMNSNEDGMNMMMNNNNNKQKQLLDVDGLQVGTHNKDFNQLLEEKLREQGQSGGGGGGKGNANEDEGDDQIPANLYKQAEPLIPILSFPIVSQIFSKKWKSKEEGITKLITELNHYPGSILFQQQTPEAIISACTGACSIAFTANVSQPLLVAMDLIKVLFNKFRSTRLQGFAKSDFEKYYSECIRLLIEHLGDPNLKLKERAENTLLEFANYPLIGSKVLFEHLISGPVKKTLTNSAKHLSGRLILINRMIGNFGLNTEEVPLEVIMNYAIKGFITPLKEVHDAALDLIVNIYKFAGEKIRQYFKSLRPSQVNAIEDALMQADGMNNQVDANNNYQQQQMQQGGGVGGQGQGYNDQEDNQDNNEFVNDSQMINMNQQQSMSKLQQSYGNNPNPDDTEHTCPFCGLFNPNMTFDQLEIHQYKQCPMLIPCFKCHQIVEISGLNHHFLNECAQKKAFKVCTRCKEPVLIKDFESHTSDKSCNQAKSPNVANRCPLCHLDIVPAGKIGWDVHLMEQTCPNNPRTSF